MDRGVAQGLTEAGGMTQANVERVIGRLVTDEGFRRRFVADPAGTLRELAESGVELTCCEQRALGCIDPTELARFAEVVDPRLQKTDLAGEPS